MWLLSQLVKCTICIVCLISPVSFLETPPILTPLSFNSFPASIAYPLSMRSPFKHDEFLKEFLPPPFFLQKGEQSSCYEHPISCPRKATPLKGPVNHRISNWKYIFLFVIVYSCSLMKLSPYRIILLLWGTQLLAFIWIPTFFQGCQ